MWGTAWVWKVAMKVLCVTSYKTCCGNFREALGKAPSRVERASRRVIPAEAIRANDACGGDTHFEKNFRTPKTPARPGRKGWARGLPRQCRDPRGVQPRP